MSSVKDDRLLKYKCKCGMHTWCIKEIVICPKCGNENIAYIPADDPYWVKLFGRDKNKGA